MTEFPNDADGDALRRVAESADLSRPMAIDYFVAVPNTEAAERVAAAARERGYEVSVELDDESSELTCYCTKTMLATYDGVVGSQRELQEIADAHAGSYLDGWGTLGN